MLLALSWKAGSEQVSEVRRERVCWAEMHESPEARK